MEGDPQKSIIVFIDTSNRDVLNTFRGLFRPSATEHAYTLPITVDSNGPYIHATDGSKYRAHKGAALVQLIRPDAPPYTADASSTTSLLILNSPDLSQTVSFHRKGTEGYGDALVHHRDCYDAVVFCVIKGSNQVIVVQNPNGAWRLPSMPAVRDSQVVATLNVPTYAFTSRKHITTGYHHRVYAARVPAAVDLEPGQILVTAPELFARISGGRDDQITSLTVFVCTDLKHRQLFSKQKLELPSDIDGVRREDTPLITIQPPPRFDATVYCTDGDEKLRVMTVPDPSDPMYRSYSRLPYMQNATHEQILGKLNTDQFVWFDTGVTSPNSRPIRVYVAKGETATSIESGDFEGSVRDVWTSAKNYKPSTSRATRLTLGNIGYLNALLSIGVAPPEALFTVPTTATLQAARKRPLESIMTSINSILALLR